VGNCGDCHTVGTVIEVTHSNNCIGCHFSPVQTVKDTISLGRLGNDVNCYSCHGEGGHDEQHDMTVLTQPSCSACHVDNVVTEHVTNRGRDCSICHDSTDPNVINAINNGKNGFTVTCFDCHGTADHLTLHAATDTDDPACQDCHNPNVVTEHVVNRGLDCINCHESTDQDVIDTIAGLNGSVKCADCHGPTDHPSAHDNAGPSPGSNCTDCHDGNVVTEHVDNRGLTCFTCHESLDPLVQAAIAAGKLGTYQRCEDCHGETAGDHEAAHDHAGVPSASCTDCHDGNVVVEHVYNRGFSCNTCHDSTDPNVVNTINTGKGGTMVTCYDCHGTNSHHNTPEAQSGNCTFCHGDPRLVYDLNTPTGQMTCRECHGSYQHGNGGPIQDYGACFACHQPTPYHAKPSSQPSDCDAGYSQAPGKGEFNIFADEFERDRRSGSRRDRDCRKRNFRIPDSLNWMTIVDLLGTDQQYIIPTFEQGDGTYEPKYDETGAPLASDGGGGWGW
jgi:hypothetical protein